MADKTYKVVFSAYSGISFTLCETQDKQEALAVVRERNRAARQAGRVVIALDRGEWEHASPDDAGMVSDREGFLSVRVVRERNRRRSRN